MSLSRIAAFGLLAVSFGLPLMAQSNFGGIRGTVTDVSGAVVPGATVTITDKGTTSKTLVTTNNEGVYAAPALRPVFYNVTVESKGFQKLVISDVKVDTAKLQTLDAVLKPGDVSTTVEVTGEAPLLQTYTGALTNTVDQKTINDIPLNGRNTVELALMLPGATGNAGTEISETFTNDPTPGRELSINGGRAGSTQFLADGANVTSLALSRLSISFTPDTIQEFSVQQANYSAQFAQAGAIIQQTTKSGTNELHGSTYWFHRQKAFTATPFGTARQASLNYDARPPLRRQQLGFTAGGPVVLPKVYNGRNKTFFFVSYEPTRQLSSNQSATTLRIPTAEEMGGDFSKTLVYFRDAQGVVTTQPTALLYRQFNRNADGTLTLINNPNFNPSLAPGVSNARFLYGGTRGPAFEMFNPNDPDPARRGRVLVDALGRSYVNPVSARLLKELYPAPNITNAAEIANLLGANYIYFRRTEYNDDRYSFKLDHRINDNHLLSGRYTWQPQFGNRFERDIIQHGLISDANRSRQILVNWTWTPNPTGGGATQVNEFRANYVFGDFARNFPDPLLTKDYTSDYLKLGGKGDGAVNLLGYGMARFYDGGALKAVNGSTSGAGIASAGFNSPQDVGMNREHSYVITDDYSWVRGIWTLKAGFSASQLQLNQANLGVGSLAGGRFSWDGNYVAEKNCSSNPVGGTLPDCSGTVLGGDKFAAFLLGVPSWSQVQTENLSIPYYYRWKNLGWYLQNDFKLSSNFTLNVGVRYQYQSPRWEKFNRQGMVNLSRMEVNPFVALPGSTTPAGYTAPVFEYNGFGRSRYLTPPQKDVFEPRFGFAWTPGFDWNSTRKFVVRGGYGITHGALMGNDREPLPNIGSQTFSGFRSMSYILGANDYQPPSNSATCGLARCSEINVPMQFGFNNPVLASDPKMFNLPASGEIRPGDKADPLETRPGFDRQDVRYQSVGIVGDSRFRMPTIQNYSLLLQYEVMSRTVITTGYQGSRATHLFGAPQNLNRVDPFTGALPYPGMSGRNSSAIYLIDPTNSAATYHAWIGEIERRFSQGLQFRFNYTWSKNIDDNSGGVKFPIPNNSFSNPSFSIPVTRAQNPYDSRSERAPAATDTPHVFNAMAFYELPFGPGKPWANRTNWVSHLAGGWQISGLSRIRSGFPITATLGGSGNSLDTGLPGGAIRPDIIPGVSLINPDWSPANALFASYVNPRAFAWPEPGKYGNAARNYSVVRLPWVQTFDFSVFKRIAPWKDSRRYFELRAEAFNVLNHRAFESNINNTNLFGTGTQNALLSGTIPFQTPVAGVENRNRNLTAPGVWDAIIAKGNGVPVDTAIANLPGPGAGGLGCPSNAAELGQQVKALSPACVARSLAVNTSFYRLNQNTIPSRTIQFALKFYF